MTNTKWKKSERKLLKEYPIFSVWEEKCTNPRNGHQSTFFLMTGLDWANVIALTPDKKVVLVKQYRRGTDQYTLEIPGGCIEKGEQPIESAIRELREETGYGSQKPPTFLGTAAANPAMQTIKAHTFLIEDVTLEHKTELDLGEDIEVILMPLDEVLDKLRDGSIDHAIVLSAFLKFLLKS